jgi:chemosensory pili system protein ChpA (sensor histidine kinase/response regulator)
MMVPVTRVIGGETLVTLPLILIVDDDTGLLKLFSALIRRLDCELLLAPGGSEALDILDQTTPDLIILDLAMPYVSGYEVLQYARAQPRLDQMRVLILTARPNLVPEVADLGIDGWLSKPIMPADLIQTVSHILNGLY